MIRKYAPYYERDENSDEYFSRLHSPSERQKETEDYLFYWCDFFIAQTSQIQKLDVFKSYAQRKGKYDPFRNRRLNVNFGVKSPSEVNHIPIVEPYWRRMQGVHKSTPVRFQVTSNNTQSLLEKRKEKTNYLLSSLVQIEASAMAYSLKGMNSPFAESLVEDQYNSLKNTAENLWRSELEIESQHALNYLVNRCRVVDVADDLFDDYGTSRHAIYQSKVEKIGQIPIIRALDPRHVFVSKHTHTKWLRDCDSYVYKELLLLSDVIQKYGEYLTKEDIELLEGKSSIYYAYNNYLYAENQTDLFRNDRDFQTYGARGRYVEVWYVEWKALNKKENTYQQTVSSSNKMKNYSYRQDRYECVRIGQVAYVKYGKSQVVIRDQDDEDRCYLTINGLIYNDRFGANDSLWQKCQPLNDDYDVYRYHLNNYIARSGHKVTPVIVEAIPAHYGKTPQERILAFYEYEKQGIMALSSADKEALSLMQSLGGVRDRTISNDVMTLAEIMNLTELIISKILGPNPQSLGDIQQNDGKGTVEMAVANFLTITQDIFMDMHHIKQQMLTDLLNNFRLAFPDGFKASYCTEGKQVFFQTSKKFSLASYNVFLSNTGEEKATLDLFKQIAMKMAESGELDKKDLAVVLTAKSVSELQRDLYILLEDKKNQKVQEMQSQMAQYEQQLKDLKRQIDLNQQAENEVNARKLEIEEFKAKATADLSAEKNKIQQAFNQQQIELDTKRVNLESQQLLLGDKSNEEVRNN